MLDSLAMNPYAKFVQGGDPRMLIVSTPQQIAKLVHNSSSDQINRRPASDKWSVRDVLCHLADTEIAFGFRLRQALAEDRHVIQPFDQDRWAGPYARLNAEAALAAYESFRKWNIEWLNAVRPDAMAKAVNHPERGDMTLGTIVETMAGHDLNHVHQIENLLKDTGAQS